jgi:hypothetical protein
VSLIPGTAFIIKNFKGFQQSSKFLGYELGVQVVIGEKPEDHNIVLLSPYGLKEDQDGVVK